ncbi:MAG: hypothetical protein BWX49_00989 [Bacteroidetes bacterium ADurb.Bin008]|jgi:probable DNA metabolism protein|nr:MAG: hypothetical protein BWX49_00989 [Bacteroidetes bacterium ADurb.Bin008]
MLEYLYDGTFAGLLTAIFHAFRRKEYPDVILRPQGQRLLFATTHTVETDDVMAQRVLNGIERYGGKTTCEQLLHAFLSQSDNVEILILQYARELFFQKRPIMADLGNSFVLQIHKLDRRVLREVQRVLMFIRFERSADGIYFAPFAPKYDVLPLAVGHFKHRFADQQWAIYDTLRDYGFHYHGKRVEQITINAPAFSRDSGKLSVEMEHENEDDYREMWREYFRSIAISERLNPTLQRNFMPKRFWKYLTEKRI